MPPVESSESCAKPAGWWFAYWAQRGICCQHVRRQLDGRLRWVCLKMGKWENPISLINLSFGDGLHSSFIAILGWFIIGFTTLSPKELLSMANMMEHDHHPLDFWVPCFPAHPGGDCFPFVLVNQLGSLVAYPNQKWNIGQWYESTKMGEWAK